MSRRVNIRAYRALMVASVKMYFRNRQAVFFTLFIPVMFILIFGAFNAKGGEQKVKIDLTNLSKTPVAQGFVDGVKKVPSFDVRDTSQDDGRRQLEKGDVDMQVVLPVGFGAPDPKTHQPTGQVQSYYSQGRAQQGQTADLVLTQIASTFNLQLAGLKNPPVTVQSTPVSANNQTYLDYLVPGIVAMSIMQLGIFSIAFAFVSYKSSGALRRLHVTPTSPVAFLFGQSVARLGIGLLQVGLLLGLAQVAFHLKFVGSYIELGVLAVFGTIVFLAFGFAVAGWAKDENQAAPVANLISFPMLFLSGTFFPRDSLPQWLKTITGFLPLTYLADAMRAVANNGTHLWQQWHNLVGLGVWGVIVYIIAIRVFKWE